MSKFDDAYDNVLKTMYVQEAAVMRQDGNGFTVNLLPYGDVGIEFHYPISAQRRKHFAMMLKKDTGFDVVQVSATIFGVPGIHARDLVMITKAISKAWQITQERVPILGYDM